MKYHLSPNSPSKQDCFTGEEGVWHIWMVAFMSSVDLTLVQITVTLIEQNVMNQILMTLLNLWLYLKTTTNREEYE